MALGVASVDILPSKQKMCREFDVPRIDRQYVDFDSLMQSSEWAQAKGSNMALPVCPAVTIEGKPYIIDLKDGVHYFIPGTTGAGKSVFANALMLSLIDSGRDFTLLVADGKSRKGDFYPYYSKSEYLLNDYRDHVQGEPICKGAAIEPEDMAAQFEWLVWAMEQRFSGGSEDMTPIIYLMDEMKDVVDMLSASDDKNALKAFTRNVGRLAQKARSVNITILFCTQSPNSEWLPQTLRAVIPSVFAFAVSSAAQSRVCIGENGCEKLLGKGDGYAKINGKTTRIHGANVTIDHIGRYLK
jgi:S-DNA-T family DNA segregation ATPase FtsK/SpoIIIE